MEGVVALGGQVGGTDAVLIGLGDGDAVTRARERLAQQVGQAVDGVRAEDDVDVAEDVEELFAVALADAAAHGHHAMRDALARRDVAHGLHLAVEPGVGGLAHAAREEDHDVGLLDFLDLKGAGGLEHAADTLGVMEVHLAAEGADEVRITAQRLHGVDELVGFGLKREWHESLLTVIRS